MLLHHQRVWEITLKKQNICQVHSHTPLWLNSHLPELYTIPDPAIWASYGILYLNQVLTTSGPKTFQALKDEFSLPSHLLFRYLQLRHAVRTPLTNLAVTLDTPPVLNIIVGTEHCKLISNLYYTLRLQRTIAVTQTAKICMGARCRAYQRFGLGRNSGGC